MPKVIHDLTVDFGQTAKSLHFLKLGNGGSVSTDVGEGLDAVQVHEFIEQIKLFEKIFNLNPRQFEMLVELVDAQLDAAARFKMESDHAEKTIDG